MYVVRIYRDINSSNIVGAKIVDENTLQSIELDWKIIEEAVINGNLRVENLEIGSNNRLKLKNLNPNKKIKYYNQILKDNLVINQYCIITSNYMGKMSFIADYNDSIITGNNVTVGEIAAQLNIPNIADLKLYNAYIESINDKIYVYVFTGNGYRKLQTINEKPKNINFGRDWKVEVETVDNTGAIVRYIRHRKGAGVAQLPLGISHIEKFGGYVNNLILPVSVKSLGRSAFTGLDDIETIQDKSGIQVIPDFCFYDSSLKSYKFSGNEIKIGESAFEETLITGFIGTSAKIIGQRAFSSTNITILSLHKAEVIGKRAFEYCRKLRKINLNDGLKVIEQEAFRVCTSLLEIDIPKTVTRIEKGAFVGCIKLKQVRLSKNTIVGSGAFPINCKITYYEDQ